MQILKRNKGITLVALIITIIILLILAGVSISFLIGDNGVINRSQSAVNEYEEASKKEQDLLEQIDDYLEKELSVVDSNGLAKKDTTIVAKDDSNIQIVIPKGFAPAILQTGRTDSMPGENGAVKEIMPVEQWNNITKDDINKGIVVVDNVITYDNGKETGAVSDFNEYVWIPMPESSKFTRVAWDGPYNIGSWQSGTHPLAESSMENAFWEDTTTQEYEDMINSIGKNKGFYISRYEASQKDDITAQNKRNQNPWVNITQTEAITASSNMNSSINSHLIYGIEWDSILQWLLDSEAIIGIETGETNIITQDDIQKYSNSWGNYSDSVGGAAANSGSMKASGTNEYWKANNIYDLSGNIWEWTQEKYSIGNIYVSRGGNSNIEGAYCPAVTRGINLVNSTDSLRIQSRILCVVQYKRIKMRLKSCIFILFPSSFY